MIGAVTGAALLFGLIVPEALRWLGTSALDRPGLPGLLHGVLLLVAGMVTGSLFPVAAGVLLAGPRGVRETASGLEAADHLGAAAGAFLPGVILVPLFGLGVTCLLVALANATTALLLATESKPSRGGAIATGPSGGGSNV